MFESEIHVRLEFNLQSTVQTVYHEQWKLINPSVSGTNLLSGGFKDVCSLLLCTLFCSGNGVHVAGRLFVLQAAGDMECNVLSVLSAV